MSDADWIEEALAEYKYELPGDLRRDIVIDLRQAYAAHIAACDTTNLAERIADVACDYAQDFPKHGGAEFQTHVAKLLAPLLARNAAMEAVLRECRAYVQQAINEDEREYNLRPLDEACRQNLEESSSLLHGIDQLTAKGAEA